MEETIAFAIVAILIGFSKGGLGGPVPVALTVPILTLIIEPRIAVGMILPMLLFADVFALYFYWRQWSRKYIALMLIPGLIGVLLGAFALADIDATTLKRSIGGLTLVALSFKIGSERLRRLAYHPRDWHGWFAGCASGFGSTLANVGAPPFTAYLLLQPNMTPQSFVGTTTLFFAVMNLTKLPSYIAIGILDLPQLVSISWVFLVIPVAVALARGLIHRINQRTFEWIMMAPLIALSLYLLIVG